MKTALKFILIIAVLAFLAVSTIGTMGKHDDLSCTGVELTVSDSLKSTLISSTELKDEMKALMEKNKISLKGKKSADINLGNLESILSCSPYVDTIHAAFNAAGKLILTIHPRIPALHVMAKNGEEYYLDRSGKSMPVGNINGNLAIVTGNITKKFAKTKLATLGRYIQDNSFWSDQIQQIDVVSEHNVRLYTRVADHVVLLGDLDSIPDKLHRLRVFYQNGLPQTGWNKYESINVSFQGIVIGTKKESKHTVENIVVSQPQ